MSRTAEGVASEVREDVGRRTRGKHWDLRNHAAWEKKKTSYVLTGGEAMACREPCEVGRISY